ncbi:hypothetical protein [Tunicatimonas pelagia]|uniref:hypothetical protein n=1 Tax=Tunicatimonas pelagia TaxID=931531 RepID=UPI00266662FA|nr:hypothetical protein [Tunicatimonas pelagia]WKN43039.1 hypothetical protein P0M28_28785 [Tunicatimonas pelagia]
MKKLTVYLVISMMFLAGMSCKEQPEPLELGNPDQCPTGRFTTEAISTSSIRTFIAEPQENVILYHWYINDTLVWSSDNRTFAYDFWAVLDGSVPGGAGDYEICLRTLTPDCPAGTTPFCEALEIAAVANCPSANFTTEQNSFGRFTFTANSEERALYYWYVNGILAGDAGNSSFSYDFLLDPDVATGGSPGDYDICLRVVTPSCHQGSQLFCEKITVESTS